MHRHYKIGCCAIRKARRRTKVMNHFFFFKKKKKMFAFLYYDHGIAAATLSQGSLKKKNKRAHEIARRGGSWCVLTTCVVADRCFRLKKGGRVKFLMQTPQHGCRDDKKTQ